MYDFIFLCDLKEILFLQYQFESNKCDHFLHLGKGNVAYLPTIIKDTVSKASINANNLCTAKNVE